MTGVQERPVAPARRTLDDLDEAERNRRFDELQALMPNVWELMRRDVDDESVVVVPSLSRDDNDSTRTGTLNQAMEERSLFLLLLLRQPRLRMVYVTSMPISESIVEYYLGLLPGVIPRHARQRLTLVSVNDSSPRSLSAKLLEHPRLLRQVRALIPNPEHSHLVGYNVTKDERDVALSLGIPIYGCDPRLSSLGDKTGCRRLFEEVGTRYPIGVEDLHSPEEIVAALVSMRSRHPQMSGAIVKLNDGVSGQGNAVVDLLGLPEPGGSDEWAVLEERVASLQLESETMSRTTYFQLFAGGGGIVEERISGKTLLSPSVQLRVLPDRSVELLSTHDQVLGGASGQSYLGCVFPADPAYASMIAAEARPIAERLAELGVLGRFAIDFVVAQDEDGEWSAYAIELNLRKGGTTHPFLTLQFLSEGSYDAERGLFLTPGGHRKHLVATDHLESPSLRTLREDDVFDIIVRHGLHFDQARQTGVVLHMISCLTELGRIGLTAVGDTPEQAMELHRTAERVLLEEARAAAADRPVVA
ncbi:MAG: peptide ligase PGM1-related protein [Marmoricola sp.]